jgi:hypothetical protein
VAYYIVSYDLHGKRDYKRAHQGIVDVSNNIWAKPLESFYIIHSNKDAEYIRDFLVNYVDNDDSIVVIITDLKDWAVRNINVNALNWIREESK